MPELGKYAFTVLACYGATIAALAILIGQTALRSRRVRAELARREAARGKGGPDGD